VTTVVDAAISNYAGATGVQTYTVPAGVTSGMWGVFVLGTATGAAPGYTLSSTGVTFTTVDARAAVNSYITVVRATGLVAGATITFNATVNTAFSFLAFYQDAYSITGTFGAGVRSVSSAACTSGSVTPASGDTVLIVSTERTTATGTTVSSVTSSGSETVTQIGYKEDTAASNNSFYFGSFTASAAAARTATATYNSASTNGYCAVLTTTTLTTPIVGTDTQTLAEGTTALARTSALTDTLTLAEGTTALARSAALTDAQTLTESSSLSSSGGLPVVDSFTQADGPFDTGKWVTWLPSTGGGGSAVVSNRGVLTCGSAGGYNGGDRVAVAANVPDHADSGADGVFRFTSEVYALLFTRAEVTLAGDHGYALGLNQAGNVVISEYTAGSGVDIATMAYSMTTGVDYRYRFRTVTNVQMAKVWIQGDPEPDWQLRSFSTTHAGAGATGWSIGGGFAPSNTIIIDDQRLDDGGTVVVQDTAAMSESSQLVTLTAVSASDTITLTEGTTAVAAAVAVADTWSLTEGTTGLAASSALVDSWALADVSAPIGTVLAVTDTWALTEGATGLTAALPVTDIATQSDAPAAGATASALTDTWALTDTSAVFAGTNITASDTWTLTETSAVLVTLATTDAGTLTDQPATGAETSAVVDSWTLTEASALNTGALVTASDSWSLTETSALAVTLATTDTATGTEGTTAGALASALTDTWTLTEASNLNTGSTSNISGTDSWALAETSAIVDTTTTADTWTLTETSSVLVTLATSDTATSGDVSGPPAAASALTDSAALAEGPTALAAGLTTADSWSLTEGPTGLAAFLAVVDSWSLADASNLNTGGNPTGSDTWTLGELAAIADTTTTSDTWSLGDVSALLALLAVTDTSTLTDTSALAISVPVAVTDTATLTEASALAVFATATDAANQVDAAAALFAAAVAVDSVVLLEVAVLSGTGITPAGGALTQRARASASVAGRGRPAAPDTTARPRSGLSVTARAGTSTSLTSRTSMDGRTITDGD
jgi:hypothetical protein